MLSLSTKQLEALTTAAALLRGDERDKFLNDAARLLGAHPSDADVAHVLEKLIGVTRVEQLNDPD